MSNDDPKKYRILENILQKVNQKYISLPPDEVKRNNKLLLIIDSIIQKMRDKSILFNNLYQNKYYGGSYYDNLKVGQPSEYDLDCLLSLPKLVEATVEVSDRPGYVYVTLNMNSLEKQANEAPKYPGLDKLLDDKNRLSTKKVRSWMEGLMASALKGTSKILVKVDGVEYTVKATFSKSGPALTIKLQGVFDDQAFDIDVDLVPCLTFFNDQWPKTGYRQNPSEKIKTFFVVPKSPNDTDVHYWRLSFQEQEKELISGYAVMKPTIRLIKKIRDRYQHKIASYFIKTVFLWELENMDKAFWKNSLSFVFMTMLRKYGEYVANGTISYYWNSENNLIGDLPEITSSCIANKLKNIVDEIERTFMTSPYGIVQCLLTHSEVDMETFKKEVPLGKKQLKQLGITASSQEIINMAAFTPQPLTPDGANNGVSSQSSVASSFEEITKDDLVADFSKPDVSKLETLCLKISSQQAQIITLLESVSEKVDKCERELKELRNDLVTDKKEEEKNRNEITKLVIMMCKKVHDLTREVEKPKEDSVNLLLAGNEALKRTADFKLDRVD